MPITAKKPPVVILINGRPTAGKDTFVTYVTEIALNSLHLNVRNFSSISLAKEICATHLSKYVDVENKTPEYRKLLVDIGIALGDIRIKDTLSRVEASDADIAFIHVREAENIAKFVSLCKEKCHLVFSLFIDRSGLIAHNDIDDVKVTDYNYSFMIYNNKDLSNLREEAAIFLTRLNNFNLV